MSRMQNKQVRLNNGLHNNVFKKIHPCIHWASNSDQRTKSRGGRGEETPIWLWNQTFSKIGLRARCWVRRSGVEWGQGDGCSLASTHWKTHTADADPQLIIHDSSEKTQRERRALSALCEPVKTKVLSPLLFVWTLPETLLLSGSQLELPDLPTASITNKCCLQSESKQFLYHPLWAADVLTLCEKVREDR